MSQPTGRLTVIEALQRAIFAAIPNTFIAPEVAAGGHLARHAEKAQAIFAAYLAMAAPHDLNCYFDDAAIERALVEAAMAIAEVSFDLRPTIDIHQPERIAAYLNDLRDALITQLVKAQAQQLR